jgi:YidC/Oxa1 family membrane protein insertase
MYSLLGNVGLSILGVSLAVNIACLPLYAVAEKWQQLERDTQKRLKPRLDSIKAVFKGDERYFILSTFYRQNKYHPVYALRSTFGLLIQVPFFIAAYNVLSHLPSLAGVHFLGIPDLSKPDGLITIGALTFNLLPVIMTVVNIAASAVYTKGFSLKEKAQLYVMAALFLLLLYDSPSGLVFYWTLNNIFSLVKNVFYKMRNPLKVFWLVMTGMFAILFILLATVFGATWQALLGVGLSTLFIGFIPMLYSVARRIGGKTKQYLGMNPGQCDRLFVLSCVAVTLLAGCVIPGLVVGSSPQEFSFTQEFANPLTLIFSTSMQAIGFFLFWPLCLYLLFSRRVKAVFCVFATAIAGVMIVNAFVFQGNYGTISRYLTFETAEVLTPSLLEAILDVQAMIAVVVVVVLLFTFHKIKPMIAAIAIVVISFSALSVMHIAKISGEYSKLSAVEQAEKETFDTNQTIYGLSKTRKNVMFIMLDRAIGSMVPYAFEDSAEVSDNFTGFTWYPNTASFGGHTLFGAPPLFGGYDYTPDEMNKRSDVPLVKKNNEALTALPKLFSDNGWRVTATDMPLANYCWVPDNSIYSGIPNVKAINLTDRYTSKWLEDHGKGPAVDGKKTPAKNEQILRNMLRFSIMKGTPNFLRSTVYQGGTYWNDNWSFRGNEYEFIKYYASLDYLAKLTDFDSPDSNLLLIQNETPHWKAPPKKMPKAITKRFRSAETLDIYEVNLYSYEALGRFFKAMKDEGVYDNTRIIIASDHGFGAIKYADKAQFPDSLKLPRLEAAYYNPVLMVKDFGGTGPLRTDMTFMTNADAPDLATRGGVVDKAANPWTGNPFAAGNRKERIHITTSHNYFPSQHGKTKFSLGEGDFVWLHDSIFGRGNWETEK